MALESKFLANRYEFKYVIDTEKAKAIKYFVRHYLEPDKYTNPLDNVGYAVHSLYLDSPDLTTCASTMEGKKNRFKLRLRFYDSLIDSPVFFEIKRRENKVILKQRAAVIRANVPELLQGRRPRHSDLIEDDAKQFGDLLTFCDLQDMMQAEPAAFTSYTREGYEPPNTNVCRVTFDRNLRAGRYQRSLNVSDLQQWASANVEGVVVELKFTDRFPNWMHNMVEWFDLTRGPMPKYVKCVSLIHPEKLNGLE